MTDTKLTKGMRLRTTLSGRTGVVIGFHSCAYTHTPMYEIQWDDDGTVTSSVDPGWMPSSIERIQPASSSVTTTPAM